MRPGLIRLHVVSDGCLVLDQVRGDWDRSLFLVIPLRLGLDALQEEHVPALLEFFSFPQCLGLIGGTPRHALYLVGVRPNQSLLCLDPHTTQSALGHEKRSFFSRASVVPEELAVDGCRGASGGGGSGGSGGSASPPLPSAHLGTMHGAPLRSVPPSSLDPSLAVGFLCRSEDDLDDLVHRTRGMCTRGGRGLFDIVDSTPAWAGGESTVGVGWMSPSSPEQAAGGAGGGGRSGAEERGDGDEDDDEFVLL